ncbi:hypothetical protein [Bacillus sp. V59.32b]|uniref:hypothetical protein n=1 Tax=Bacillus sp. V59.32b TaxID=1758642 RepID=UPI000E3D4C9F|nr:hypothetical protein [Bacillus sp. V59.32b]RFU70006.1 hypothetical protein D0463_00595 [Bacillus sp. V59.32b]
MIPCITKRSIKHLYNTADERYNFSHEFFRKTHFPQLLNRYYKDSLIEKVTEESLLNELEDDHPFGNRVYIIYGSTGSGKSELLCWLKDQWIVKGNKRPIIRISRSELNPQLLIKKCYQSLEFDLQDLIIDENKWHLLLNKPIAIITQLVWSALDEIFDRDEDIVPTAMLLRPVIEKNVLDFTNQVKSGIVNSPLEIITIKEFEQLIENTTVPITVDYWKFRHSLSKKLDDYLFQGVDIQTIFKNLTEQISIRGIRPVILIDDLVQSMNLYASDILDFFITLEEGRWDVVIGLTPGVLDGNESDIELKNRINNLDTIDDRVKKLWLSDESGNYFYSLDKDNAKDYLLNYIKALKEANGFKCSQSCQHAQNCSSLLGSKTNSLLPLNEPLINRIFDGLPAGKGVLRYMIMHTREILSFLLEGNNKNPTKIKKYFSRDVYSDHDDVIIKLLAEMYADSSLSEFKFSLELLRHFNRENATSLVKIKKLTYDVQDEKQNQIKYKKDNEILGHIRDWVEGKKVNKQLLEPIRFGVGTILNEITKGTSIMKADTSRVIKSTSTIQKTEVINRLRYPISFEKKDNQITIEKKINLLNIADFQKLKMQDRPDAFAKVANDLNVSKWTFETENLKKIWIKELEENLGYNMESFVFYFKNFINKVNVIADYNWSEDIKNPIKTEWLEIADSLFLDWFSLRDNIIDYNKLRWEMVEDESFERHFLNFNPSRSLNKFHIKNYQMQSFIIKLQFEIKKFLSILAPIIKEKINEINKAFTYLAKIPGDLLGIVQKINLLKESEILSLDTIQKIGEVVNWIEKEENKGYIVFIQSQQKHSKNISKVLSLIEENDNEIGEINSLPLINDYLKDKLKLRRQVRKHLLNLIENGETQLPKQQWKGIIRDIEVLNPELFNHLNLNLKLK